MNMRILAIVLAGVLVASGAPVLAHGTKVTTVETWTNGATTQYTATTPSVVYVEQTPRVVYIEGTTRRYDADGNRVYTREVYVNDWTNRSDVLDPTGRGMSPAEVSN